MDLGLDRAFWSIERGGQIWVREAIHVAEHHCAPVRGGQRHQQLSPVAGRVSCHEHGEGAP
jgi:hypothetical protein